MQVLRPYSVIVPITSRIEKTHKIVQKEINDPKIDKIRKTTEIHQSSKRGISLSPSGSSGAYHSNHRVRGRVHLG